MEFGRRDLERQFGDKEEESTVVTRDRLKGRAGHFGSCPVQTGMADMSGHPDNLQLEGGSCMQEWVEFEIAFHFNVESEVAEFRAWGALELASLRSEASFAIPVSGE